MKINYNLLKAAGVISGILGYSFLVNHPLNAEEQKQQDKPNILWFFI